MSQTNQLVASSNRLQRQGLLFFQQTRQAGVTFVSEARDASAAFVDELSAATAKLTHTTGRSATAFGRAIQKEADHWRELVIKTRDAYAEALDQRWTALEARAVEAREAVRPATLQTKALRTVHDVLDNAAKRVDERLEETTEPDGSETKKSPTKAADKDGRIPIRNYDELTAKDVVGRIRRLSAPQASALLDYEKSRKNRTTVVRAAKQRLSATG